MHVNGYMMRRTRPNSIHPFPLRVPKSFGISVNTSFCKSIFGLRRKIVYRPFTLSYWGEGMFFIKAVHYKISCLQIVCDGNLRFNRLDTYRYNIAFCTCQLYRIDLEGCKVTSGPPGWNGDRRF